MEPLTFEAAKPMATKGDPVRLAAYERAWERSPQFRRAQRVNTAVWGAALLAEAILRVIAVYRFSVQAGVLLSQVPGIVLIVAALVFFRLRVPTISTIVDAQQEELVREHSASRAVLPV